MPLLANKVYVLNKIRKEKKDEGAILFHPLTNEICENAEELARKTFLYNQNIWTCKITGQINLTFMDAQKSEIGCGKLLKTSFMKCYEQSVLQHVHHNRDSLENIINKAWTQIHEEFLINEPVVIKLTTPKELTLKGIVVKINRSPNKPGDENEESSVKINQDTSNSDKENIKKKTIPKRKKYHYSVKLLEMDKLVNDIPSETIERTMKAPSKDQIRMFIRAHAIRHSGKTSNPWIVNDDLVKKYKLPNTEPKFICDKAKVKEMSHTAELQMYYKLMDDAPKKNGDVTVDLTLSEDEDEKARHKNLDTSGSKKLKQMTLMDMPKADSKGRSMSKTKSPLISPSRAMPPVAQQLLRLMKENKDDSMINQLVLKCCQYSDAQISKFPELIQAVIKEKKDKLELKRKLKNMSPEEREAFMTERRIEQRNLQREKRKVEGKVDDADMDLDGCIVEGVLLSVDHGLSQVQWARLVSVSEFVFCFKGLLGPASVEGTGDLVVGDFIRAVTGTKDRDKSLFAELVCLLLKPLLQDSRLKKRTELGVSLGELPVTACTATELLKLILPWHEEDDKEIVQVEVESENIQATSVSRKSHRSANTIHNNAVAGPICEQMAQSELDVLCFEDKISILELLQERILELEIIGTFIDECQREATEAYKKRLCETKDFTDRLKEVRSEITILTKQIEEANEALDVAIKEAANEDANINEDISFSTRRRLSLEMKSKEQEVRDKCKELERQMDKLEKDEMACRRGIDSANVAYNAAINEAKQLMRVQCLGSDRFYRRYWLFKTAPAAMYVEREQKHEREDETNDDKVTVTEWRVITTLPEIEQLVSGLDERGVRENALKKELQASLPILRRQLAVIPKNEGSGSSEVTKEDETKIEEIDQEKEEEGFLVRGFKNELRETEINIQQGALGGVEDFDEWERTLTSNNDFASMKQALVAVFLGVHERFWNTPLKTATARGDYLAAISDASTQSRLNMLQYFLDVCICWSKSASDDKCRVCHKNHKEDSMLLCDGCNRAYHMFCLRPPLRRVPQGEWLCPDCKAPSAPGVVAAATNAGALNTRSHVKVNYEEEGEEESNVGEEDSERDEESEEEEEEVCCVCQTSVDGLGKCIVCYKSYHADCHEPALRHMPRAGWTCGVCHDKVKKKAAMAAARKNKGKRTSVVNGGPKKRANNDDDDDGSDEEKRGVTRKKSRRGVVGDQDDESEERRGRSAVTRKKICRGVVEDEDDVDSESEEPKRPVNGRKRGSVVPDSNGAKKSKLGAEDGEGHQEKSIKSLIKQMMSHKSGRPFLDPVDETDVPDYYTIVTKPVDLTLIDDRRKAGLYTGHRGLRAFLGDVAQMFINADLYNEADTDIMVKAHDLEQLFVSGYEKCDLGLEYVRKSKS